MANIIITDSTNTIKVDFGVLGTGMIPKKGSWRKNQVIRVVLQPSDQYVKINILGENEWAVSFDGNGGMQVDSINASAPSSNSDLYDKLVALIV